MTQVFAKEGPFAKTFSHYQPREAQIQMAESVHQAIVDRQQLLVEAGTGTGKTYAYLVPTLLSGKKAIISTGTKNLQEQLYLRDLPVVQKILGSSAQTALLKGRSNYLCLYRLEVNHHQLPDYDRDVSSEIAKIRQWASETVDGDLGSLTHIEEDSRAIPYVTSTVENCLGKDCPYFTDCYVVKARKKALEADLVVVNHHLFFADMALKDTGFGELIPNADVLVFDEAHQVPDIATDYFGEGVSTRQMLELARDVRVEFRTHIRDMDQLGKSADKLEHAVSDMRLQFPDQTERGRWHIKFNQPNVQDAFFELKKALAFLYDVLKLAIGRSEAIDRYFERCIELKNKLSKFEDMHSANTILWYETTKRHLVLRLTPLSIADKFSEYIRRSQMAWVFTSATLSVDDSFHHFTEHLGLSHAKTAIYPSPFDYPHQALLCVPRFLPEPNSPDMGDAFVRTALPLIEAAKGRTFLLFTSYRMMLEVGTKLKALTDLPLLVQGTTSKRMMLERFTRLRQAVLLGTASFWEGIDVRGDALTCVMIDKLPFASPADPLLQAKAEVVQRQGLDPFATQQLPQAVISLKQGVGRLIRDVSDQGVLVICDNRLVTRPYGEVFIKSLPPMKRTRDLDQAVRFLKAMK
nr:ATP-dependent DNA helicase [Algicola sagamiensis]